MRKAGSKRKDSKVTPTSKFWESDTLSDYSHLGWEVKAKSNTEGTSRGLKTIHNVSLQAYPIPTQNGSVKLAPGASVNIPLSLVSKRLINLQKRRLITIR
tara:strand:+ start:876 stop:1175 length:300 start_codon:yes stop_codon:yes gene_type:complete